MIVSLRYARDRLRFSAWWLFGIVVFLGAQVASYPLIKELGDSFEDSLKNLGEGGKALIGLQGGQSLISPAGFLNGQVFGLLLPIGLICLGVSLGSRAIAGSEDDGSLEIMLSNPVSRVRAAAERYLTAVGLLFAVGMMSTGIITAICAPLGLLKQGVTAPDVLIAGAACTCLGMLYLTVAFAVGGILGGRGSSIAISSSLAVASYILFGFVSANVISFMRFVTPWWWYGSRNIMIQGLPPEAILLPFGISAILAAVGVWRFSRRDLR